MTDTKAGSTALLNDTPSRNYVAKLRSFNEFAQPEIRAAIASLELTKGMRILDAGCGSGEALQWFHESVSGSGSVTGIDLALAHVVAAREKVSPDVLVVQADLLRPPFPRQVFDVVWCVNTIGHLRNPVEGLTTLSSLLRPGGRVALGQSSFLPDMFFAWDARLERVTNEAVRYYYRDRYGVTEHELTGIRGLVGLMKQAGLRNVSARTSVIERMHPLAETDRHYLYEAIFRDTWGERLKPYLSAADFEYLERLCNPTHREFALAREDFHFLQTFSVIVGSFDGG